MGLLSSDGASFAEVARVLSSDAALSGEVLRLANSPLGGRFGTTSILQALSLLGVERIRGLVLTLTMSKLLSRAAKTEVVRSCWRHNLACGLIAKRLATQLKLDPDFIYSIALLHDIGRLALLVGNLELYQKIILAGGDTRALERDAFGIDHCEAGAWVVSNWNLPFPYVESCIRHHDEEDGEPSPAITTQSIAQVGCRMANQMGFSVTGNAAPIVDGLVTDNLLYEIASTINAVECERGLL